MAESDIDLIVRVITDDDRHAFGELVKRHQSGVRNHLRQLTKGDHARADDLAQDTFVKAYRAVKQFRGDSKFSTWLYRIAYRTFLNDQRKTRESLTSDGTMPEMPSTSHVRDSDLKQDLQEALTSLKPEQAAAIDLHFKKGLSHRELAEALEMPLGTVKTHLSRGLKTLREHLKDWRTNS